MAKEKKVNYSDTERKIVEVLKGQSEPMTLEEIGKALGMKLSTGNINALVNIKGNVKTAEEDREIETIAIKKVKQYLFNKDID